MIHNKELSHIAASLKQRNLGEAFVLLENYGYCHPEFGIISPLGDIRNDFDLMAGYWKQGYRDSQSAELYERLLGRMYRLTADTYIKYSILHDNHFRAAYNRSRAAGQDWSIASVRHEIENFVADMALLELEPENKRKERSKELRQEHGRKLQNLFDFIRTSPQWSDAMADEYVSLLLSPTIDNDDRLLIISAIMMGVMWVFDINKWSVLARVYRETSDEKARQRALVGWVLTLGEDNHKVFHIQKTIVGELLADGNTIDDLVGLQMQMIYCANAENDHRTIQDEIMPEIIKNNKLRITPNGIEEQDDDPMESILDSGAAERKMAEMEENFKRMMDMQKSGADIYFGGFSQMKRFPFFDNMSNWFLPFSMDNPAITNLYTNDKDLRLAAGVIDNGSFCESDKYSFVIAFHRVVGQMPANVREMLSNAEAKIGVGGMMGLKIDAEEQISPTYIRRIYLQDLYRFFALYPSRDRYANPFKSYFFVNGIFTESPLKAKAVDMAVFMVKRKLLIVAEQLLVAYGEDAADYNYCLLRGYIASHTTGGNDSAVRWYADALAIQPNSVKALAGYGRGLMNAGEYLKAASVYEQLLLLDENNTTAMFNRALCLVRLLRYEEAMEYLYRLDYERPDNARIQRLMAEALMNMNKLDQAEKLLSGIISSADSLPADKILYGVVCWCKGDVQKAVDSFCDYLRESYPMITLSEWIAYCEDEILRPNVELLLSHGLTDMDFRLMMDVLTGSK